MSKLKEIREVIIKANRKDFIPLWFKWRPIRLADILYAVEKMYSDVDIITKDPYYETFGEIIAHYNLLNDDLEQQSPEFIDFIHSILIKK